MSFFNNFAGMGPEGGQAPEPRTALGRFWQIYTHHTLGLLGAGILAAVTALVYILAVFLGVTSHGMIFVLVGGPLGGILAMPQIIGVADTVLRAIRGEAGFWWMKYRAAWKKNLKQSLAFGFLVGLLCSCQYFLLLHARNVGFLIFVLMLVGIFISVAVATWSVPQIALMNLPLGRILVNSLTLSAQHPVKTLAAVAVTVLYWFFLVVTYPISLLGYVLFNFWLPMLVSLMILWRPIDEAFDITEKLEALNEQKRAAEKAAREDGQDEQEEQEEIGEQEDQSEQKEASDE